MPTKVDNDNNKTYKKITIRNKRMCYNQRKQRSAGKMITHKHTRADYTSTARKKNYFMKLEHFL